ncbi:hypothetical protein ACFE04_009787 [Oxalis oulophora]
MRMSCNGCRVLRKGCSENCTIRPCLQWIKTSESQANATVFLAKFYGRAGLINLINAGPDHLRPAVFRSLLYEACGRIVNPIYGSLGLLWSGSWQLCQAAVEAVLKGASITPISTTDAAATGQSQPFKACDIRHVSKDENSGNCRIKSRKRSARAEPKGEFEDELIRSRSNESTLSHELLSELASKETDESMISVETRATAPVELQLSLGFEPVARGRDAVTVIPMKKRRMGFEVDSREVKLGLEIST